MISTKALRAAGLTDAQIVAVREAELFEHEERLLAERERQRIKKRNQRARPNVPGDGRDNRDKTPSQGTFDATPNVNGPSRLELEKQLFDRGKQVLGQAAGGMIVSLLRARDGNLELARAAIETASTKQSPREYIGALIKGGSNGHVRTAAQPSPHSREGRLQRTSEALGKLRSAANPGGGSPDDRPTFDGLWSDDKGPSRS